MRPRVCAADLLTIGNGVCGFGALATLANSWLHAGASGHGLNHAELITCLLLYALGMLFDVLDGPVARWRGSSGLGSVLDTICDTISFGMLPAMLLLARFGGDVQWRAPVVAVAAVYVGATIMRLARHAQREADQRLALATGHAGARADSARGAFAGMPAPVGGNCLLALVVLAPPAPLAVVTVAVIAALMVADFPYPNNHAYGGVFVAALLVASFAAIAGLISLDIPAAAALIALLPLAFIRVIAQWNSTRRQG